MTLLGREIVDAVSIAAVTATVVVAGRREERTKIVRRYHRPRSRLATISALGVVALVAAAGVVAVFGPRRARGADTAPHEIPVARAPTVRAPARHPPRLVGPDAPRRP